MSNPMSIWDVGDDLFEIAWLTMGQAKCKDIRLLPLAAKKCAEPNPEGFYARCILKDTVDGHYLLLHRREAMLFIVGETRVQSEYDDLIPGFLVVKSGVLPFDDGTISERFHFVKYVRDVANLPLAPF